MAIILNIETSTTNCSVSIAQDGQVLVLKEDYSNEYSHSERLHNYIDSAIKQAGVDPKMDIDAIAISKGPGSYTGLRIGTSSAKGLCYSWDKPLISVPTLEVLAHQVAAEEGAIVSMLDARRMEVYSAVFDGEHRQIRNTKAEILDSKSFEEYLKKGKVLFIGNGVEKTAQTIVHSNAIFIEGRLPSANEMGMLSFKKFNSAQYEDVAYFEPFYLKDFISLGS